MTGSRHLAGGWVQLAPADVPVLARAFRWAVRTAQERDRITARRAVLALRAVLDEAEQAALVSAGGPADVRDEPEPPPWPLDEIGTEEAARMIGVSERQVRRLARREELGRLVGQTWRLDRAEVAALALRRRAAS